MPKWGSPSSWPRFNGAVIGTGFGAEHARQISCTPPLGVSAIIYGRDHQRAAELAAAVGASVVSSNIQDALSPDIDFVVVCTPVATHRGLSLSALSSGKALIVDKPLALNVSEAKAIVEAARGNTHAYVYFQWRHHELFRRLKTTIAGDIGRVSAIQLDFDHDFLASSSIASPWRHSRLAAGSGAIGDMAVHLVDVVQWLSGELLQTLFSTSRIRFGERTGKLGRMVACDTEDLATAVLRTQATQALVTINVSRVSTGLRRLGVRIVTDAGAIIAHINLDDLSCRIEAGEAIIAADPSPGSSFYREFGHALQGATGNSLATVSQAAEAQRILDEIIRMSV